MELSLEGIEQANQSERPIIGIAPTYKPGDGLLELPDRYVQAVVASGGAPLVIPFTTDVSVYEALFPAIDGFLLSGGQDIHPIHYGQDVTYGKVDEIWPERDDVEYLIVSFARQFDVPLLGICRGMQMINVSFGGTLVQDLAEERDRPGHWQEDEYHVATQSIRISPNTLLSSVIGQSEGRVNSMHHQGIDNVGTGLVVSAYAEDRLVEAIEADGLTFLVGVQWHPEFYARGRELAEGTLDMAPLFDRFVSEAQKAHKRGRRCGSCLQIRREECGGCFPLIRFAQGLGAVGE